MLRAIESNNSAPVLLDVLHSLRRKDEMLYRASHSIYFTQIIYKIQ